MNSPFWKTYYNHYQTFLHLILANIRILRSSFLNEFFSLCYEKDEDDHVCGRAVAKATHVTSGSSVSYTVAARCSLTRAKKAKIFDRVS